MTDRVELQTNGVNIKGFDEVKITNSIDCLCGSFELTAIANINSNIESVRSHVIKGMSCHLFKDGKLALTGYIKDVCPYYVGSVKALKIIGRSKAGDILDSSALGKVYRNLNTPQIISSIIEPFNVALKTDLKGTSRLSVFSISAGEKLEKTLARLCRPKAAILFSDEYGNLTLTGRGSAQSVNYIFKTGKNGNLTGGSIVDEDADYSKVALFGQSSLEDEHNLDMVRSQIVSVDFTDKRHKTRCIFADNVSDEALRKEIQLLAKKSRRISLNVANWPDLNLNAFERAEDYWLGLSGKYLVAGISYRYSNQSGHLTDVVLEDADV